MKNTFITFDVEPCCIPHKSGSETDADNFEASKIGLSRIMEILDGCNFKCTFFVTTDFAERNARLVKRISKRHEIASHGVEHEVPAKDRLDYFKKSRETLSEIIGVEILGFRAPRLAISRRDFPLIKRAGFRYDSSIRPTVIPGRFNSLGYPNRVFRVGSLIEFPISVFPLIRIPLDWFWFRNLGPNWSALGAKLCLKTSGYFSFMVHPWEFAQLEAVKANVPGLVRNTGKRAADMFGELLEKLISQSDRLLSFGEHLGEQT